jgi:hypothetical protein
MHSIVYLQIIDGMSLLGRSSFHIFDLLAHRYSTIVIHMADKSSDDYVRRSIEEVNRPDPNVNNRWYERRKGDTTIVFVHGIFSDSRSSWCHNPCDAWYQKLLYAIVPKLKPTLVYWPDLVKRDSRFDTASIFLGGYHTDVDSRNYTIRHCSTELFDALDRGINKGVDPVLSQRRILFVCHSTGGIVVRHMLEKNWRSFQNKSVGLLLIASPSTGAALATRLKYLARVFKNGLAEQLQNTGNESLDELDERFFGLIKNEQIPQLTIKEACEAHFIFHNKWLPFSHDEVVPQKSAERYAIPAKILFDTDHFSCVKPSSENHVSHELLVDFFSKCGFNPATRNAFFQNLTASTLKRYRGCLDQLLYEKSMTDPNSKEREELDKCISQLLGQMTRERNLNALSDVRRAKVETNEVLLDCSESSEPDDTNDPH